MHTAVIIPARYQSTRLPGKPLVDIAGKTMLQRVVDIAKHAVRDIDNISVIVATDNERIVEHANTIHAQVVMTPADCLTGSDRVLAAIEQLEQLPDYVINLQGDTPLTPPDFVTDLITALHNDVNTDIATPVVQLTWQALDTLRKNKQVTPFSGTTAIVDHNDYAIWFSKHILPAIRNEDKVRGQCELSPVFRHIGMYGYKTKALQRFASLPESPYEALEGLEQLRALENGLAIKAVRVDYNGRPEMTGVDTAEDAQRAADLIKQYGEIL